MDAELSSFVVYERIINLSQFPTLSLEPQPKYLSKGFTNTFNYICFVVICEVYVEKIELFVNFDMRWE